MPRPPTITWHGQSTGTLGLLDQRQLPTTVAFLKPRTVEDVYQAIKTLAVRGAPAIGVAAAYGIVIAAQEPADLHTLRQKADYLKSSRPTAVNLAWAVNRVMAAIEAKPHDKTIVEIALAEARAIHAEDAAMCQAIGRHGAELIHPGASILTHCNAGYLA